jgi:hypothetical protein
MFWKHFRLVFFFLQIFGFFTPKHGGLMVQLLWDFWISKSYGCCVVHFSNKTLNFNYVKKYVLVLVFFFFNFGSTLEWNLSSCSKFCFWKKKHSIPTLVLILKIKLGSGLVLGDPILYLFGIIIEIKSNEGVYNKQYYNHVENM